MELEVDVVLIMVQCQRLIAMVICATSVRSNEMATNYFCGTTTSGIWWWKRQFVAINCPLCLLSCGN